MNVVITVCLTVSIICNWFFSGVGNENKSSEKTRNDTDLATTHPNGYRDASEYLLTLCFK